MDKVNESSVSELIHVEVRTSDVYQWHFEAWDRNGLEYDKEWFRLEWTPPHGQGIYAMHAEYEIPKQELFDLVNKLHKLFSLIDREVMLSVEADKFVTIYLVSGE